MDRRATLTVLIGSVFVLLLITVSTSGAVTVADRAPTIPWSLTPREAALPPPPPDEMERAIDELEPKPTRELPPIVDSILEAFFIGAGLLILLYGLAVIWRSRPRIRWTRAAQPDDFDLLAQTAALITADADAQFAALQAGSPRNAIVECWLRLEASVTDAGFEADPADTTAEFTTRVLSHFSVDAAAVDHLSALYREARFSTHELSEARRADAVAALTTIHRSLLPYRNREHDAAGVTAP